ncbi:MAG: hypothetical protein JXA07_15540 [Spirochaetes bacterium]|nr:hypothetical protein [Spirochaetota bacterium]
MPSAAAQVIVTVIPIVGIVTGGVLLFFFLYWSYKQRVLMIEKGQYVKFEFDFDTFSLLSGLVLTFVGACLVVFFIILEGFTYPLLSGLIPLSVGVSLLVYYMLRAKMNKRRNEQ